MAGRSKVIDPSKITDLESWLKYSNYGNVKKTTDNQLLVLDPSKPNDLDAAKSIPHTYGLDYRVALHSNDAEVRGKAERQAKELMTAKKSNTAAAQTRFLEIQKEYMAAVKDLESTADKSEQKKKVPAVLELASALASADEEVRSSSYPDRFVKVLSSNLITRRFLNNATMDDRKIIDDLYMLQAGFGTSDEHIIAMDKV
jgi:hypothetical protein